jgi:hypothetical protein
VPRHSVTLPLRELKLRHRLQRLRRRLRHPHRPGQRKARPDYHINSCCCDTQTHFRTIPFLAERPQEFRVPKKEGRLPPRQWLKRVIRAVSSMPSTHPAVGSMYYA